MSIDLHHKHRPATRAYQLATRALTCNKSISTCITSIDLQHENIDLQHEHQVASRGTGRITRNASRGERQENLYILKKLRVICTHYTGFRARNGEGGYTGTGIGCRMMRITFTNARETHLGSCCRLWDHEESASQAEDGTIGGSLLICF